MSRRDQVKQCRSRSGRRHCQGRGAFTLVEVMAAMAVLVVLVLMLSRILSESITAFDRGNTLAVRNAALRAALETMREDLRGMVVDPRCSAYKGTDVGVEVNWRYRDEDFDRIAFISTTAKRWLAAPDGDVTDDREYQMVYYYVTTNSAAGYTSFRLMRAVLDVGPALKHGIDVLGSDHRWVAEVENLHTNIYVRNVLVDNVVRFDIWTMHGSEEQMLNVSDTIWGGGLAYDTTGDWIFGSLVQPSNTPFYIQIYLQVASEDAMRKAGSILDSLPSVSDASEIERLKKTAMSILYQESEAMWIKVVPDFAYADIYHRMPY